MQKISLLLVLFLVNAVPIFSQIKHDFVWTIGYGPISPSGYGGIIMDFNVSPRTFKLQDYVIDRPKAAISDKYGQLVAYTNGCRVLNRNHQIMLNGDTLSPGEVFDLFCGATDYPLWQPTIFLPKPGSDSLYYLFHLRCADWDWNPMNLMYSVIDASGDEGNGAVTSKNQNVISDSLYLGGYVTATRHSNGRDWWVIVPRHYSNNVHVSLLGKDGVDYMGMQDFDHLNMEIDNNPWSSQTAFSTDGSKYFRNSPQSLLMLDFDRCTGILSNPVRLDWDSVPFGGGGVAVSPNSRFLYLTSGGTVQQYDLWASNLAASMQVVAVYDGFLAPYAANFFQMMPGPDGIIYIISSHDNYILHVIHNPDSLGIACNVEQHAITLPARTSYFIPNFANYNLGPIDGSSCDTLGIDNPPIANFRWNMGDTLLLKISFTDLSNNDPLSWHWDFGDNTTSQDTNPNHLYNSPGNYIVCLTVCNSNACDTVCKEVRVGLTSIADEPLGMVGDAWWVWPNPVQDVLNITQESLTGIANVQISNLEGRVLVSKPLYFSNGQATLSFVGLPQGVYLLRIADETGEKYWMQRVVKM